MASSLIPEAFAAELRALVYSKIRSEYPYLESEVMDDLLSKIALEVQSTIAAETPHMMASKTRASFLHLPPELRNHIYELVIGTNEVQVADSRQPKSNQRKAVNYNPPAIVQVNRQIRSEALSIFHADTQFVAYCKIFVRPTSKHHIIDWLQLVGKTRAGNMKSLVLKFDDKERMMMALSRRLQDCHHGRNHVHSGRFAIIRSRFWRLMGLQDLGVPLEALRILYRAEAWSHDPEDEEHWQDVEDGEEPITPEMCCEACRELMGGRPKLRRERESTQRRW